MQTPTIGSIVHIIVDPATNNGSDVAPAVITRVWGDAHSPERPAGPRHTINVRVLGDSPNTDWRTSVYLLPQRPADDVLAEENPHNPQGYGICFWPPRV